MTETALPASLNFRMPAEWEPQSAVWLSWPHNPNTWPGQDMAAVESVYVAMIRALHSGQTVNLLVNDRLAAERVSQTLDRAFVKPDRVRLHIIPTNDAWIRDYGPNFIVRPSGQDRIAFNKWLFNSWGGKYDWKNDNQVGDTLAETLGLPVFHPGIILEGGAIEVNGRGTCITTEQCLLNKNRNGGMTREQMEKYLRDYLGARNIIWCQGEMEGDDTDGHIDNLVRFVNPDTVLCASEEDPRDPNRKCLEENYKILTNAKTQDGKPLNVVRLPMPGYVGDGETRLPASYANFYIGNKTVLLPTYGQQNDRTALYLLKKFFPGREIAGIPCRTFIWGLGGIHCVTQQQPAV